MGRLGQVSQQLKNKQRKTSWENARSCFAPCKISGSTSIDFSGAEMASLSFEHYLFCYLSLLATITCLDNKLCKIKHLEILEVLVNRFNTRVNIFLF